MKPVKYFNLVLAFTFLFSLFPVTHAKVTFTDEELLEKTYNYRKIRKELLCRDTDTKNLTCLWAKVDLIYSKQKLNKTDIDESMTSEELDRVERKISIITRRHAISCIDTDTPAKYCGFLSSLIEKSEYLLNSDEADTEIKVEYLVTNVVDGDTIDLNIDGKTVRARLIGMNTPERSEFYFDEATDRAKELLENQYITIEKDSSQSEYDKYERLLIYVILSDGKNFAEKMIKEGYAKEYTYNTAYKYQSEFKEAENEAKSDKLGIWFDYKEESTEDCSCGEKTYCTQMNSCEEAKFYLNTCGLERLDADGDGTPCESLCSD